MAQNYKHVIGISGNALVGKDTLCKAIIQIFKQKHNLVACRRSIAGDFVREDLKTLILEKTGKDIYNLTNEEKTLIRPIMVEYGRVMRSITNGRYFIDRFVPSEFIDIIPDIRYCEYEKDELYWIKEEQRGFLIFMERGPILPANKYEEENNKIIKKNANIVVEWPTFDLENLSSEALKVAESVVDKWFEFANKQLPL